MQVLADDVDIRELDAQWFRSQLGVVSQEPSLFSDSVAANITYGLPGTTRVRPAGGAQTAFLWLGHSTSALIHMLGKSTPISTLLGPCSSYNSYGALCYEKVCETWLWRGYHNP